MSGAPDLTAAARATLVDALEALGGQLDAFVVVGAQAIYLRVGEAYTAVAPFTTDGDLLINPALLTDDPLIERLMEAGGFELTEHVGIWSSTSTGVTVDLLVPASVGGAGRRAARLGEHGRRTAIKVPGLEGALVDNDLMTIHGIDDERSIRVRVAGPAALLVSKVFKLADRQGSRSRLDNKDALDVFRLLQGTPASDVAERLRQITASDVGREAGDRGLAMLAEMFGRPDALGSEMAASAVVGVDDGAFVAASCTALVSEILERVAWTQEPRKTP